MHPFVRKACLLFFLLLPTPSPAADIDHILLPSLKAGRVRPLVAIVADNSGTETTDIIVPYGVMKMADVADVLIVSTHTGTVNLIPALVIEPDMTTEAFNAAHPAGADIVIVPAMHDDKNPTVIGWIRDQAGKGAFVAAICEGAWISARTGILRGSSATTHWYAFDKIGRNFPQTRWIRDQRYVVDRNVMTTTGVTASIPASLALVEAIAGYAKAKATALDLGVEAWSSAHSSASFHLTAGRVALLTQNYFSFWTHEVLAIPVVDGFDEIALALSADAWSRTYRSHAVAVSAKSRVRSRHGLIIVPDDNTEGDNEVLSINQTVASAQSLNVALKDIAVRYGKATADLVALQLEYEPGE